MFEDVKYYIEQPMYGVGMVFEGWCKWRSIYYWQGSPYNQDEFKSLEEAKAAAHREGLEIYKILKDTRTVEVVYQSLDD